MKKVKSRLILCLAALIPFALLSGCVPKSIYDRDIAIIFSELQKEKAAKEAAVSQLQAKLKDKAATLSDLTDRYMRLQAEKETADVRLGSLSGDLLSLSNDVQELKLVVSANLANIQSTLANELLIKLIDMEHRISEMLKAEEAEEAAADKE